MNKIYAHKNNDYERYIFRLIISLIPLLLYGIYKNGILLYTNNYIDIFDVLKPLFIPLIGLVTGIIIDYIRNKKLVYENALYGFIIGMIMPISINYLLFAGVVFMGLLSLSFLDNKININKICLIKIIIIIVLVLLNCYNYCNALELEIDKYSYNFIYLLLGRTISGISISSTLLILLSYLYLSITSYYYKKDIPLYLIGMYLLIMVIYSLLTNWNINYFINPSVYFAFIYIATIINNSPYLKVGKFIYALLIVMIGVVGIIVFNNSDITYIGILLVALLSPLFNKIKQDKITN